MNRNLSHICRYFKLLKKVVAKRFFIYKRCIVKFIDKKESDYVGMSNVFNVKNIIAVYSRFFMQCFSA